MAHSKTSMIANVKLHCPSEIAITEREKGAIAADLVGSMDVRWLDEQTDDEAHVRYKPPPPPQAALETMVLVFFLGAASSAIAKPFLDGLLGEAGKDSWQYLKKLCAKIWKTQNTKTYSLKNDTIVILQQAPVRVAVELRLRDVAPQSMDTTYDAAVDQVLNSMFRALPQLSQELSKADPDRVCVIRQTNEGWTVWAIEEKTFRAKYKSPFESGE